MDEKIDLDAIEKRWAAARCWHTGVAGSANLVNFDGDDVTAVAHVYGEEARRLLAGAPADIAALVAECRRLAGERTCTVVRVDPGDEAGHRCERPATVCDHHHAERLRDLRAAEANRDALAARVGELEGALEDCDALAKAGSEMNTHTHREGEPSEMFGCGLCEIVRGRREVTEPIRAIARTALTAPGARGEGEP